MHLATKNILTFQKVARERIDEFFTSNSYKLVLDEWDKEVYQTMLCQWSSFETSDTFQLRWDIRERWFDLGYFDRVDHLNYRQAQHLLILPMNALKLFRRKDYANRKADKLIEKIKEKLSTTSYKNA
ncbi:MAG: hypothetical protein WBG42_04235 [Cryomorphaceae bacterium]